MANDDWSPLLDPPFASAWSRTPPEDATLRGRLRERVDRSLAAEAPMTTVRLRRARTRTVAPGATLRSLYSADTGRALRNGEPLATALLDLDAGASCPWSALDMPRGSHVEVLVMRGDARIDSVTLGLHDYHLAALDDDGPALASDAGARLFLRVASLPHAEPLVVRDAEAGWPAFGPGIERRVLWQGEGQAAMLYRAAAGAAVPHHGHGHDEECLMVEGELFLDDVLLQAGDYQLAPAGSGHDVTETDVGVIIYAHGDLDLRFR